MYTIIGVFFLSIIFFGVDRLIVLRTTHGDYKILSCAGMIVFIILLVFTVNNPDYKAYEQVFLGGIGPFQESKGFMFLTEVLYVLGIHTYKVFLLVVGISIVLMMRRWGRLIDNIQYVVFFYTLFIMYYDVIQIRNCISTFCTISALLLYLYEEKKRKIFGIVLLLTIAVSFHPVAVLQIALIIYSVWQSTKDHKVNNISQKEILILFLGSLLVLTIGRYIVLYLGQKIPFFWKITIYMTSSVDFKSFAIWSLSSSIMIYILYKYGIRHILEEDDILICGNLEHKVIVLFRIVMFSLVLSPLTLYMDEIVRIYRFFFLLMFIIYAMIRNYLPSNNKRMIFASFSMVNITFMIVWVLRGINFDNYW